FSLSAAAFFWALRATAMSRGSRTLLQTTRARGTAASSSWTRPGTAPLLDAFADAFAQAARSSAPSAAGPLAAARQLPATKASGHRRSGDVDLHRCFTAGQVPR